MTQRETKAIPLKLKKKHKHIITPFLRISNIQYVPRELPTHPPVQTRAYKETEKNRTKRFVYSHVYFFRTRRGSVFYLKRSDVYTIDIQETLYLHSHALSIEFPRST